MAQLTKENFKARISAIMRGADPNGPDVGLQFYTRAQKSMRHKRGAHWKQLASVERRKR